MFVIKRRRTIKGNFSQARPGNSYAALVSLLFYRSSSVAAAVVLGARGIVLVVCSIVLSATHVRPYESCMATQTRSHLAMVIERD